MKLNKYNYIKDNVTPGTVISTGTTSSNTQAINLDRTIWGQQDSGNNIGGDLLCNGNMYVISEDADNPENTLDLLQRYNQMFNDEGNLYVEKAINANTMFLKGDSSILGNLDVRKQILCSSIGTSYLKVWGEANIYGPLIGTTGNFDILNTQDITAGYGDINTITGSNLSYNNGTFNTAKINSLKGDELEFLRGFINELESKELTTEYLTVTKQAHFFELIIDKIKSAGGAVILSPADGFKVDMIQDKGLSWRLLWKADDGEKAISNMWQDGDQAICQTFNNAQVGANYNISNKYYWALVCEAGSTEITNKGTMEPERYNYIDLSKTDYDGTLNPEVGDEIVMLGSQTGDVKRQSAIYISAYKSVDSTLDAPLFCHYKGINDFNLSNHKYTWFAANGNTIRGNLLVESGKTVEEVVANESDKFHFNLLSGTRDFSGSCFYHKIGFQLIGGEIEGCKIGQFETLDVHIDSLDYQKTYTLSFWIKVEKKGFEAELEINYGENYFESEFFYNDEWKKVSITFSGKQYANDYFEFYINAPGGKFQLAGFKIEEGEVKDPIWAPSVQDLETEDVEWYSLRPVTEVIAIDKDKHVNVNLEYEIIRHIGNKEEKVAFDYSNYELDFVFEPVYDGGAFEIGSNGNAVYKRDDIGDWFGYSINEINTFIIEFRVKQNLYERKYIPVVYEPYALLEITDDKIRTAVQDVEGHISEVEQKANSISARVSGVEGSLSTIAVDLEGISTTVSSNYGALNSKIEQTASSLRTEFNNADDEIRSLITVTADEIRSEVMDPFAYLHPNLLRDGGKIGTYQREDSLFYYGSDINNRYFYLTKEIAVGTTLILRLIGRFGWAFDIFEGSWTHGAPRYIIPEELRDKDNTVIDITWKWSNPNPDSALPWLLFRSVAINGHQPTEYYLAEAILIEGDHFPKNFTSEDYANDTFGSIISQTSSEILAQVDNTYVKIIDGNIILNGTTTVQNSEGLRLIGENNEEFKISSESIGTYDEFSKSIFANNNYSQIFSDSWRTFDVNVAQTFILNFTDNFKQGQQVIIKDVDLSGYSTGAGRADLLFDWEIAFINADTGDVLARTTTSTYKINGTFADKFIPRDGKYAMRFTGRLAAIPFSTQAGGNSNWLAGLRVSFKESHSTEAKGQIAYDGLGMNFGGAKTAFFNKENTIIKYDNCGIKIAPNNLCKLTPNSSIWMNMSTPTIQAVNTVSADITGQYIIYVYDNTELLIYTGSNNATVRLGATLAYNGRTIKFKKLGTGSLTISTQNVLGNQTDQTIQTGGNYNATTKSINSNGNLIELVYYDNKWLQLS